LCSGHAQDPSDTKEVADAAARRQQEESVARQDIHAFADRIVAAARAAKAEPPEEPETYAVPPLRHPLLRAIAGARRVQTQAFDGGDGDLDEEAGAAEDERERAAKSGRDLVEVAAPRTRASPSNGDRLVIS
jgi:hypothetical protein